ncbi:MAG: redoxin domain-containing protein [Bacteroidota bacterium]
MPIFGYAAIASAASLCQQIRWSVCHGIGCNICPKRPLITASRYIETGKATLQIKNVLKEAYIKDKGAADGYDQYYNSLVKKQDVRPPLLEAGKLDVKSIDFTLKDTDGKPVTLSSYKGWPVVLYFFSMDFNTPQRKAFNTAFNKIVAGHAGRNTVFLGIDRTSVSETDEANGMQLRIEKVNNFLAQNNLNFKVLLDVFHRDPSSTARSYYAVADTYSSGDVCQFYVIDKTGIVRYKSFPYSPMPVDQFDRELTAALKLVE